MIQTWSKNGSEMAQKLDAQSKDALDQVDSVIKISGLLLLWNYG